MKANSFHTDFIGNMRMTKLKGLYVITDPKLRGTDLISKTEQAILGGINILQYRNKTASLEQQEKEAFELAQLCKKNNVLFLINDNIELALKVNADGVHLGQKDAPLQQARKQLGVTCNNKIKLAIEAQKNGADYVAFGRFFNSKTKPSAPPAELSLISEAKKSISIPIAVIGGITQESAPLLLKEGVDMLAVIHGIFGQDDILSATRQFGEIIDSPK
jgi:thiamine-phosphate pyrophosphorylase